MTKTSFQLNAPSIVSHSQMCFKTKKVSVLTPHNQAKVDLRMFFNQLYDFVLIFSINNQHNFHTDKMNWAMGKGKGSTEHRLYSIFFKMKSNKYLNCCI